jgi:hypothetical protein
MVQSLTKVKHPREGVLAKLIDIDHPNAEPLIIFLGRTVTASAIPPNPDYFSSHPNSDTVLESIVHTLKEMPSTILASLTTSGSNDSSSSLTSYHPRVINQLESDQLESDHEPECNASTLFDAVTLADTQVLHASTQSTRTSYHAEDRFVGSQIVEAYVPSSSLHNLRQIKLELGTLSLFDFAVLADCVHNHDPLYSLLEHRCYWFAQIIFAVIEKLYPGTTIHSEEYAPAISEDTICIPANDYLPDLAGKTMGISVCKIEEAVVSVVASNFRTYKEAKRTEVHFFSFRMTFAKTWIQIQTKWEDYHQGENALHARVSRLERVLRAHNVDPGIMVDVDLSQQR